ncbi:MAG: hypothetical protein DRH11_11675 [Deltaproteobacteria bacterium]|nr:MAG: hypothetical protein DRH11_11675 [Deltaproteobacteria bacterium]
MFAIQGKAIPLGTIGSRDSFSVILSNSVFLGLLWNNPKTGIRKLCGRISISFLNINALYCIKEFCVGFAPIEHFLFEVQEELWSEEEINDKSPA